MGKGKSDTVFNVDTREYLSMVRELLEQGQEVNLPVAGTSMSPFLKDQRDMVYLRPLNRDPRKGDIVLYQRAQGQYVLHRVCKVSGQGYYMAGDNQNVLEGPVVREQIFAVATEIYRNGKWVSKYSPAAWFFRNVWIRMVPCRGIVLRILRKIKSY